jgi:hypothetical protein
LPISFEVSHSPTMKARKTYFLVPPSSSPVVGSIVLGNVISDPILPADAVNQRPVVFPSSIPICYSIPLKNWKWSRAQEVKVSGGIFAQFVGALDFEISARKDKETKREYFCKELETQSFQISAEYIGLLRALPEVQAKIIRRENLYVITGIKIAKGATVNEEAFKSLGFRLSTTVDLTALGGAPVRVGPQAEFDRSIPERFEYNIEEDFVFAYRLEEVFYRWRSVRSRPFVKEGDIHGFPSKRDDEGDDEEQEDTMDNFVFDDAQNHDIPASVVKGMQTGEVRDDDGEKYNIVWMNSHP